MNLGLLTWVNHAQLVIDKKVIFIRLAFIALQLGLDILDEKL